MSEDKAYRRGLLEDYDTSVKRAIELLDDMAEHLRRHAANEYSFWESLLIRDEEPSRAVRKGGMQLAIDRDSIEAQMKRTRADIDRALIEMRREYAQGGGLGMGAATRTASLGDGENTMSDKQHRHEQKERKNEEG